jgi:hypothetical protein
MKMFQKFLLSSKYLFPILNGFWAAIFIFWASNLQMPWEQDQPAKAAQLHALIAHGYEIAETPDLYRKNQFALYYYLAAAFKQFSGLQDYVAMNVLAALSGGIFIGAFTALANKVFAIPPFLALAVAISSPAIFVSFTYGNEAGFALMFLTLSLLLVLSAKRSLVIPVLSGIASTAAALCRLDYAFFIPIVPLFFLITKEAVAVLLEKRRLLQASVHLIAAIFGVVLFYALVIKELPIGGAFEYNFSIKQAGAYLIYGLGLFLVVPLFLGLWKQFQRNWLFSLLWIVLAAHALAYVQMFSSPKYALPLFFVGILFASSGLFQIWKRTKFAAVSILVIPWFVSVTPFGIKPGQAGAFYFIPTDDGPMPSGAFFSFYNLCRKGFFQQRYVDEEKQIQKAIALMPSLGDPKIVGFFNQQTPMLIGARQGNFKLAANFWPNPNHPPDESEAAIMIKTSYLHPRRMSPEVKKWFLHALESGSVQPVSLEANPFPDVILVSKNPENINFDKNLATRIGILFAIGGNEQWLERDFLVKEFKGTSWAKIGSDWTPSIPPENGQKFYSLKSPPEILALNTQP